MLLPACLDPVESVFCHPDRKEICTSICVSKRWRWWAWTPSIIKLVSAELKKSERKRNERDLHVRGLPLSVSIYSFIPAKVVVYVDRHIMWRPAWLTKVSRALATMQVLYLWHNSDPPVSLICHCLFYQSQRLLIVLCCQGWSEI